MYFKSWKTIHKLTKKRFGYFTLVTKITYVLVDVYISVH